MLTSAPLIVSGGMRTISIVCVMAVGACGLFPSLDGLSGADAASDAPSTDGGCGAGSITCDGACVSASDPMNCNGCGNVCPTGLCGSDVTASLATLPPLWVFNGKAVYEADAGAVRLVPPLVNSVGSFIYTHPIAVDTFTLTFDYRATVINGARADGLGFMLEQTGRLALGGSQGAGLGIAGLVGYGVEIDVYDNGTCGDQSDNHLGIDDLTVCSTQDTPTSLFATPDLTGVLDLADGQWHAVVVTYATPLISVSLDGVPHITNVAVPIEAGTPYYFGFGATVGGIAPEDGGPGGCTDEIRNVDVTFPTPRCL
jgi:Bacterial lectin